MRSLFCAAAILLLSLPVVAQQQGTVDYTPDTCITGGEMPLFHVTTHDDGVLRAFFRKVGTADWCSVDGENRLGASTIVLPRYITGEEIEYYFAVLNGKQVVAKSPRMYRVRAAERCSTPFETAGALRTLECLPASANVTASSLAAGYRANIEHHERPESPEKPEKKP